METIVTTPKPKYLSELAICLMEFKNASGRVYASIWWDPTYRLIVDVWEGAAGTPENFKAVLLKVLDFVKEFKAKRWLAELSGMQGGFQKNEEWLKSFVMVKAEELGIEAEAVVMPGDIFATFSTKNTVTFLKANSGSYKRLRIEAFSEVGKAWEWLMERCK